MHSNFTRRDFVVSSTAAFLPIYAPAIANDAHESFGLSYMLRIVLSVGSRLVEGASIIHVGWHQVGARAQPGEVRYEPRATGEAVIIQAGQRDMVFGLLLGPITMKAFTAKRVYEVLARYLTPEQRSLPTARQRVAALAELSGRRAVPRERWPALVRFQDIKNPNSVQILQHDKIAAGTLPAYVKEVTVEITERPVSTGIDNVLPWLKSTPHSLAGSPYMSIQSAAQAISRMSFQQRGET